MKKVPEATRSALVRKYLEYGGKAAAEECERLGLSPGYASKAAHDQGLYREQHDHRWEWAKKRGTVIA